MRYLRFAAALRSYPPPGRRGPLEYSFRLRNIVSSGRVPVPLRRLGGTAVPEGGGMIFCKHFQCARIL